MNGLLRGLARAIGAGPRSARAQSIDNPPHPASRGSAQAFALQQAGRRREAEALCRRMLEQDPDDFDALHLLGVMAQQSGDGARAVEWMTRAAAVAPSNAAVLCDLALAWQSLDRDDAAAAALGRALALAPDCAAACNGMGLLCRRGDRLDEAEAWFERARALDPAHAEALSNLGSVRHERGDLEGAEGFYRQSLAARPDAPEVLHNLGLVLLQRGDAGQAEDPCRRAIELRPDFAVAHNTLGTILQAQGRLFAAEQSFHDALDAQADLFPALCNLGDVVRAQGRPDEAEAFCRRALALRPDHPDALNALGLVHRHRSESDAAEACFRRALAIDPRHARAHSNLGAVLQARGLAKDAQAAFRAATALSPDPAVRYNLAVSLLFAGEYAEGFELYESRFDAFPHDLASVPGAADRLARVPRWRGGSLAGARLVVWTEQGLGDSLMMLRHLPELRRRGARSVLVLCDPALERIVRSVDGVDAVVTAAAALDPSAIDAHCPLMSLPWLLGAQPGAVRPAPYVAVPPQLRRRWAERIGAEKKRKVGLAWAGAPTLRDDARRSIPLATFAPLAAVSGVQLYSLQKGEAAQQQAPFRSEMVDWMDECADLMDTAALVDNLDLVVSVDTAVAHLAGALGKPVWLLNRFGSEWRWGLEGEATPWYPAMRIFRQQRQGDWETTLRELAAAVAAERHAAATAGVPLTPA